MTTSYNKFLQLPLFQGIDKNSLTKIIEKVKFNFKTFEAGTGIVKQGEICKELIFILDGHVVKETINQEQTFSFEERVPTSTILEPTSLFGLNPAYHSTYSCKTEANVLIIDKNFILNFLMNDNIFKLNFVNILSSKVHQQYKNLWFSSNNYALLDEFKKFVIQHSDILDTETTINISMNHLALQLRDTRLNVSKMLNLLHKNGVITTKRMLIIIPNMNALLSFAV